MGGFLTSEDTVVDMKNDIHENPMTNWWQAYRDRREQADDHQLCLFVRSLRPSPGGHTQRVRLYDRIEAATEQGRIDTFELSILGDEVCLCPECRRLKASESVRGPALELAQWEDGSLRSRGFTYRRIDSSVTEERYHVLIPPERAVGIYLDGSLEGVFPCRCGDRRYSVDTFLTTLLEDDESSEFVSARFRRPNGRSSSIVTQ